MTNEICEILLKSRSLTDLEIDILRARLIRLNNQNRKLDIKRPLGRLKQSCIHEELLLIEAKLQEYAAQVKARVRDQALRQSGFKLIKGGAQ